MTQKALNPCTLSGNPPGRSTVTFNSIIVEWPGQYVLSLEPRLSDYWIVTGPVSKDNRTAGTDDATCSTSGGRPVPEPKRKRLVQCHVHYRSNNEHAETLQSADATADLLRGRSFGSHRSIVSISRGMPTSKNTERPCQVADAIDAFKALLEAAAPIPL